MTVDYFTEDGLIKQIGLTKDYWDKVIIKEIIDNALDAIEPLNCKAVNIVQNESSLGIYDNGNGIREISVDFIEVGKTEKRGIEICGYDLYQISYYKNYVYFYSVCNPDVSFYLNYFGTEFHNQATTECVDKSQNISLAYYDYDTFKQFIVKTQDGNTTYKQFLEEYFGTRIKNKSGIKSKIKDIDFDCKEFINDFLKMGLKLYCLHDLDISGVFILDSFRTTNKKFKHKIYIEDLGVTFDDVARYGIEPENVKIKKEDTKKLLSLPYEYRQFFNAGDMYRRVELNAFTTEQMLEILDRKLSAINNLPTINLEESLNIDHNAIKQTAFMRVMADRYKDQLNNINIPIDLSAYNGRYTVEMAKKEIPDIEKHLISQYQHEIERKLNIS